jgi:enoyl-CoA hydratase
MAESTPTQVSPRKEGAVRTHRALSVERFGAVLEVTMLGPGKGNAMGPDFWREMPELFSAFDRDAEVRAVIVRGQGADFTYGLDLGAMSGVLGPLLAGAQGAVERTRLLDVIGDMQRAFDAVARCRKPVIAAISGWCIGGGLDLAAACDVRLCSADARFSLREVKVAMVADLGSLQRLPSIIGEGHTRELAYTGKNIDARRAEQIGLVNAVYDTGEALFAAARAMAAEIAENPPLVVQGIKQVMNAQRERQVEEGLKTAALWNSAFLPSEDLNEAIAAFIAKRPPQFKGR